ncbi:hypothetical protein E0Z10_g7448 [Xylaria hypoxylon]|uniref:Uncharacterized protein n=1 Tax=Xylaria hypoxylon TaxID=37992 RepID=A0A4Z0YS99_9PEZI|nr:hypothetical protein E0Z10_g7448 [Xylaria hypoxylon]
MTQTIVLITGASRGLGKGLAQRFLALPNHTVIAANRDPEATASRALSDLPTGTGSALIVTKYDAANEQSPFDAVRELREKHGISHLDIVVANAGIAKVFPLARDVKRGDIVEHIEVNVLSVISLFQATRDLLQKSPSKPIFVPIGSGAGSLGRQPPVPSSAYGASKSMLFWYGIRINAEEEWLNTFVADPGFVQTDMGNDAARRWGLKEETLLTVDECMGSFFQVLRTTTKEKHGGKAVLYTGEVLECWFLYYYLDDNDDNCGLDIQCGFACPPDEPAQISTMPCDPSGWVPVRSPDSEDDWCLTPSVEGKIYPASPVSSHSAPSPSNDQNSDSMKLAVAGEDLKEARAREQYQALYIEVQEKHISNLQSIIDKQRGISDSLETKLFDSFVVMTRNQQYELDKVQKRLLDLQNDAEEWLLGHEWRNLQQKLHDLNHKLDGYIKSSTPQTISTGEQTDELTLFMNSLLGDLPKMWNGLEKLERDIEEEKDRDAGECGTECTIEDHTSREDVNNADMPTHPSVTDILDRYYVFSRLQRERMITRKEKLQVLLDEFSTELGRLQADLAYEEGRTANMRTRMTFWEDDLGASKVEYPDALLDNLEMKQTALKCGSQELEKIAGIIQELPSHFHMIDIRAPGEDQTSTHPETSTREAKQVSGTRKRAEVAGQREDTLYIAELEAKLKEKQANEKAWAAHLENLHQREMKARTALQKGIDSTELRNAKLQKVVQVVAGKLFEHRERLWGLSTPARKMGEELISTLEQLEISCDEPLIYE